MLSSEADAAPAREEAARALAAARGIPPEQAAQQVAAIEKQYRDAVASARANATAAADAAASVVSTGALIAFVALVLGAIAGWLGGRSGVAIRFMPTGSFQVVGFCELVRWAQEIVADLPDGVDAVSREEKASRQATASSHIQPALAKTETAAAGFDLDGIVERHAPASSAPRL